MSGDVLILNECSSELPQLFNPTHWPIRESFVSGNTFGLHTLTDTVEYTLNTAVHSGSMGYVYAATLHSPGYASDGLKIAVKKPDSVVSSQSISRETAALTMLRGTPGFPYIIACTRSDTSPGSILMEFAEGDRLEPTLIQASAEMGPVIGHITLHAASILQSAHQQGIIHRDIKPDNIIFNPARHADSSGGVTVVDLALWKSAEPDTIDWYKDLRGLAEVTFVQVLGNHPITQFSRDMKSLRQSYYQELHTRLCHSDFTLVSESLSETIARALTSTQKDPDELFTSISDYGALISEILNSE